MTFLQALSSRNVPFTILEDGDVPLVEIPFKIGTPVTFFADGNFKRSYFKIFDTFIFKSASVGYGSETDALTEINDEVAVSRTSELILKKSARLKVHDYYYLVEPFGEVYNTDWEKNELLRDRKNALLLMGMEDGNICNIVLDRKTGWMGFTDIHKI